MSLTFELLHKTGRARRGRVTTPNGVIETPIFMPVGTLGAIKGLSPRQLEETGAQICLANTYHLHLRPGEDVVERVGGLHGFMGWKGPILTDSGGFQVFSLPTAEMTEEGVHFKWEHDGRKVFLSPERSMEIQMTLGADIIMAFDVCVPYPCERVDAHAGVERTLRWLDRCVDAHDREGQVLFGIVQGSTWSDLRKRSAIETSKRDLPGIAIGGVSVGEGHDLMMKAVDDAEPYLPEDRPRYLMGVGYPNDIIEAIARGIDMFDCVLPTRLARSGIVFTRVGSYRVTNKRYRRDRYPLDTDSDCYTCSNFSRLYIHHLLRANEILGTTLMTLHNVHFYLKLVQLAREAIEEDRFEAFRRDFHDTYKVHNA
ncbi:MAG: tRNA guanosine(34) transglycosylase Tgt [Myxococcales bacterium]|nr:tRNA guanosine(34) transglycosylase Tgt [Myxococcales bacterium]